MPSLHDVLSSALSKSGNEPWLPGTEKVLIHYVERRLLQPRGLQIKNYGTVRYLQQDHCAPCDVVFSLARPLGSAILLENLPTESFSKYHELGLVQRRWGQRDDHHVRQTILDALAYFEFCPSLLTVVDAFLRCIHVIESPSGKFDVSYSDPDVPLSVFVSVPPKEAPRGALRLCESLLHECMHLQLSIVEKYVSLVRHRKPILRSPWRSDLRPPIGLLHGIYVFRSIFKFLECLEVETKFAPDLEYIEKRKREIRTELKQAKKQLGPSDITAIGQYLLTIP